MPKKKKSSTNQIDSASPLYLHPSDHPGLNLTSKPFDGTDSEFDAWKKSVSIALAAKNKLSFIDSDKQPEATSSDYDAWKRCDDMVTSWILNSLSGIMAVSVLPSESSHHIWTELNDRYGETNGAQLYQLQKDLSRVSQGNSDVATYFMRMKKIWDELSRISNVPDCTCESGKLRAKYEGNQKLFQFLMGLNDDYGNIREKILTMKPLPSVMHACALVIQDEVQKEVQTASHESSSSMLLLAKCEQYEKLIQFFMGLTDDHKYVIENSLMIMEAYAFLIEDEVEKEVSVASNFKPESSSSSSSMNASADHQQRRSRSEGQRKVSCDYCKKKGHASDKCYKLVGFPKGSKGKQNARNAAVEHDECSQGKLNVPGLLLPPMDHKDDESVRWKEKLLSCVESDSNVIFHSMGIIQKYVGETTIPLPVNESQSNRPLFTLREGYPYECKLTFTVLHKDVRGLMFINKVWKEGIQDCKIKEPLGTFGPCEDPYVETLDEVNMDSGRGIYTAKLRIKDDDNKCHLQLDFSYEIK